MNNDRGTRDQETAGSDGLGQPGPANDLSAGQAFESEVAGPPGSAGNGSPEQGAGVGAAAVRGPRTDRPGAGDGGTGASRGGSHHARRPDQPRSGKGRSWWIELPILFAFALVLALLIKTFVVQAFFIPSSSMENTLLIGDKVLVNKLVYDFRPIHRGDVVVFNGDGSWNPVPAQPSPPLARLWNAISGLFGTAPGVHDYIKRVIGVPGDHVVCCDAQHRITVNGVPLNEKSYLYPGNAPSSLRFSITVPKGRLWVMGDHRDVSWDSREHQGYPGNGTIPEDHVVGRAFLIIAPVSRWRVLPIPATFEQPALAGGRARPPASAGAAAVPAATGQGSGLSALARSAPLELGFAGAIPLTLIERRLRLRRRLGRSRRRR